MNGNDSFSITGNFSWKVFNPDGTLKQEGGTENRVFDTLRDVVIEGIYAGSMPHLISMCIGVGSGQDVTTTALASLSSYENSSGTHWAVSQPSNAQFKCIATFTATGTWSITEAGMATNATSVSSMCVYNDTVTASMTSGDTLQGTWTINTYT